MSPMILSPIPYADGQHVGCGCSKSPSETDMTRMATNPLPVLVIFTLMFLAILILIGII